MKLVLPFLVLLFIGCALALVAVRQLLISELDARLDIELAEEFGELDRLRSSIDGGSEVVEVEDDLRSLFDAYLEVDPPPPGQQTIALVDGILYRSEGSGPSGYDLASDAGLMRQWSRSRGPSSGEVRTTGGVVRYQVRPVGVGGQQGQLVAAIYVARDKQEIDAAIRLSAGIIFAFLVVGTLFTFFVAGRVVAPLRRLTASAQRVTDTDMSERIQVRGSDEVAQLARSFNDMVDRLDHAFAAQRQLLRDVGHELRTPLAIATGHLEFVKRDEENQEYLSVVEGEHRRMRHLIDDLLVLARSERRDFLQYETVDLADFTTDLVDRSRPLADRTWASVSVQAGRIVADPQRLMQAMANLVENAVRHTQPGGLVEIGARCSDGRAFLWVADDGPGVPAGERERIFELFERGRREERESGTGLGLAIARRIAEAHRGAITVGESRAGGACFVISVPIDPPEDQEAG